MPRDEAAEIEQPDLPPDPTAGLFSPLADRYACIIKGLVLGITPLRVDGRIPSVPVRPLDDRIVVKQGSQQQFRLLLPFAIFFL